MPRKKTQLVTTAEFIQPHFIEELGCEGLTASEVARSLGQDPKVFRTNFKRSFESRLNNLKLGMVSIDTFNANNVAYTEYAFSIEAAKWLVGKSNTDAGDKYLAYLIQIEANAQQVASDFTSLSPQLQVMIQQEKELKRLASAIEDVKDTMEQYRKDAGQDGEWLTVTGFQRKYPEHFKNIDTKRIGQLLSKTLKERGMADKIREIPDARYGKVNAYHAPTVLGLLIPH